MYGYGAANLGVTDAYIDYVNKYSPDFVLLYLGETDTVRHGSDCHEDMTIPFFLKGEGFSPSRFNGGSILDIAPTIAKLCGVNADSEWEGKPLI